MTAKVLEAHNLSLRYERGEAVLRDVSLTVERGEVLGIVGPNGAGKSSLLRVLAGITTPSEGTVTVVGDNLRTLAKSVLARRVSLVSQREQVASGMTVDDMVSLGRAPYTGWLGALSSRDRAHITEAMRWCDITHLASRDYNTLSGGEQKRCVIARALAQDTPILLLDEPVASLDLMHQSTICTLFAERARDHGVAVVVVLHDLNIAARYCNKLLVLRAGTPQPATHVTDVVSKQQLQTVFGVDSYVETCPDDGHPFHVVTRKK
jgi:ABC-type cobalamin/Fe3+-siderophores transport system ATPase subunit